MVRPTFCHTMTSRMEINTTWGSPSQVCCQDSSPIEARNSLSGPFCWKMNFQM